MGALYIAVLVLLTTVAAEQIAPIKAIVDIKADNETVIATAAGDKGSNVEGSGQEDLSKTMELILFRPYIPELDDFPTEIVNTNNYIKAKSNTSELTRPDEESKEKTIAKHFIDDHINKRNVDQEIQEYKKDVQYPLKDDNSAKIDVTSKPFARYEITENVIDVPDDRTLAGPVVHNYSPYRNTPLNLGLPKNDTEDKTETADEDNKHSKSRLSILHIKAEVDEQPKDPSKIKNFFKGVKNYWSGIKIGVVNGINKLFKHEAPHGKDVEGSDESGEEDEDDDDVDDFAELHQAIHKGFR